MRSRFLLLCSLIVFGAFLVRVYRVATPTKFYFDEVYHAFTATTYLHNDPKGYEYWQTPPKDVAYEWTHPPLAKLFMALGMVIFGENSFGWRISSVLFGTGVIAMVGVLAHKLFHRKKITLLALGLAACDGLLLSMSRIAMNDMHFLFFALVAVSFYIDFRKTLFSRSPNLPAVFWTAIFLGLSLASKWTALYIGAALVIDSIAGMVYQSKYPWKTLITVALIGTVMVPVIYLASYGQFFAQGHTLTQWKETTQQMWWYHTNLKATHPYQSRPLQWITDMRPVWMDVDYSQNDQGIIANTYNVGNPLLFWLGLVAIATIFCVTMSHMVQRCEAYLANKKAITVPKIPWEITFLLLVYAMLWVPWLFSPRIMFFYHYAPAVPFLCMLTAYAFAYVTEHFRRGNMIIMALLVAIFAMFVILYPLNTGLPMPQRYFDLIFGLFPTWK